MARPCCSEGLTTNGGVFLANVVLSRPLGLSFFVRNLRVESGAGMCEDPRVARLRQKEGIDIVMEGVDW
jgi:hypothetical protein